MRHPWERYLRELWERWHLLAVWEPSAAIAPGDVGIMKNRIWRKVDDLDRRGIGFELTRSEGLSDRSYSSSRDLNVDLDVGAGVAGVPVKGTIKVSFSSEGAVLFNASGCREVRIADVGALAEEVWRRFQNDEWDPRHIVVTKVLEAERAVILIGGEGKSEVSFSVKATAGLEAGMLNLASASLAPRVTSAKGQLGRYCGESLTPLFEAICIDRNGMLRRRAIADATPRGGRLEPSDREDGETELEAGMTAYRYEYEDLLGGEEC